MKEIKSFVVIRNYQGDNDLSLGVYDDHFQKYLFGDGDLYTKEKILELWPECQSEFFTWVEFEKYLEGLVKDDEFYRDERRKRLVNQTFPGFKKIAKGPITI